jgi:hypothetical protein
MEVLAMSEKRKFVALASLLVATSLSAPMPANAFFLFVVPVPNVAKPPELQKLIDALGKSKETRAVAYVSENKTFASKQWTWAYSSGSMSQEEADRQALDQCNRSLQILKEKTAGGQALYDFGTNTCKLHKFAETSTPPQTDKPATTSAKSRNEPSWKARVSSAILEGRCEEAKAIALAANDLDVAEQAVRLCVPKPQ